MSDVKPVEIVGYEICEAGRFVKPHKISVSCGVQKGELYYEEIIY